MGSSDMPDINRGANGLAADWTLISISCIVVSLRLYAKGVIIRRLGWDDALMAAALLVAIAHGIVMTEAYRYGWGRHSQYLSESNNIKASMWIFISQGLGVTAPALGRISFCFYMCKIVGNSSAWQRASLHVTWVLQAIINLVCLVMIYTQCGTHVSALWGATTAKCLSPLVQTDFGYFQSAFNSLSDAFLTILPAMVIWNLHVEVPVKIGLVFLLCLSVFAFVASLVKTFEIHILTARGDITWNFVKFVIWAALEINLVIIAASIPTLAPIFKKRTAQSNHYGSSPAGASQSRAWKKSAQHSQSRDTEGSGRRPGLLPRSTTSEEEILGKDGGIKMTYELDIASHPVLHNHDPAKSAQHGW